MNKNCLIKISGDLVEGDKLNSNLIHHLIQLTSIKRYHVVIAVGGGSQINKAFLEAGLPIGKFGPFGRETNTLHERQMARDILEVNQAKMQDLLQKDNISAEVVIPVITSGSVLCHVNGDQYVFSVYNGFEKIYIATLESRVEDKKEQFKKYPKIEIIGF